MPKGINIRNLYLGPRVNNSRIVIKCLFDGELTAFVNLVDLHKCDESGWWNISRYFIL